MALTNYGVNGLPDFTYGTQVPTTVSSVVALAPVAYNAFDRFSKWYDSRVPTPSPSPYVFPRLFSSIPTPRGRTYPNRQLVPVSRSSMIVPFRQRRLSTYRRRPYTRAVRGRALNRATIRAPPIRRVELHQKTDLNIISSSAGTVDGTSSLRLLSNIQEGHEPFEREGRIIRTKQLNWFLNILRPATKAYGTVRVIIFRWAQGYVAASTTSVLANAAYGLTSPYNQEEIKNVRILLDRTFDTGVAGHDASNGNNKFPVSQFHHGTISVSDQMTFVDDSGTSSDVKYHVCIFNDEPGSTINTLTTSLKYINV